MIRLNIWKTLVAMICVTMLVCGCGELKSPGSSNASTTGGVLRVSEVFADDYAVDVVVSWCTDKDEPEDFLEDSMFEMSLEWDNPGEGSGSLATITIISYDVEFISEMPGAVPLTPYHNIPLSLVLGPNDTYSISGILMMTVNSKQEFVLNGGDDGLQPIYEVRITVHAIDEFGHEVKGVGSGQVVLANYNRC